MLYFLKELKILGKILLRLCICKVSNYVGSKVTLTSQKYAFSSGIVIIVGKFLGEKSVTFHIHFEGETTKLT